MIKSTLVLALLLTAIGPIESVGAAEQIALVVVNGDSITTADMDRQIMSMHRRLSEEQIATFDYHKLLDKLVNDRLLLQEAWAIGMHEEESFVAKMQSLQLDRARSVLVGQTFKPDIEISDADIDARFESHYFKIQLRTLAVASLQGAEQLIAQIEAGAPMDSLATELSLDSRKFKGGLHSLKYWRDIPIILRQAAESLKPDEMSSPFKFQDSWMFLRVEKRIDADPDELSNWSKEIRTVLTNTEQDLAWQTYLDSLAADYPEKVDSTLLGKIASDSSAVFQGEFLVGSKATVVTVGASETISEEDLRREISHTAMNAGDQVFDTIMHRAVTGWIYEARLSAAAQNDEFMSHQTVLDFVERVRDSLLLEDYLGENVSNRILFNREEFQQYYAENLDSYRKPDEVQLKALQVSTQAEADLAATYLADGADFAHVADQLGRDDGIDHDENEWFNLTTFPTEVAENLKDLEVGKVTTPFQLAEGWVIFQLKVRRRGEVKTIEEVDGQIRAVMFQRKFDQLLDELLTVLKGASVIEYNEKAVDEYLGADI